MLWVRSLFMLSLIHVARCVWINHYHQPKTFPSLSRHTVVRLFNVVPRKREARTNPLSKRSILLLLFTMSVKWTRRNKTTSTRTSIWCRNWKLPDAFRPRSLCHRNLRHGRCSLDALSRLAFTLPTYCVHGRSCGPRSQLTIYGCRCTISSIFEIGFWTVERSQLAGGILVVDSHTITMPHLSLPNKNTNLKRSTPHSLCDSFGGTLTTSSFQVDAQKESNRVV